MNSKMPPSKAASYSLIELADLLSGVPSTAARGPVIDRLLAALWRGEFEAFSKEPHQPCKEVTLRALQMCGAVPRFSQEKPELEFEPLSKLKFDDFDKAGQAILTDVEFPRRVVKRWRSSLQSSANNLDYMPKQKPSPPSKNRAGRPFKHNYDEIDELLSNYFNNNGTKGFKSIGTVVSHLLGRIGKVGLPPESTLRSHINDWIERKKTAQP